MERRLEVLKTVYEQNKELAADFLKALLQEEIQSSITGAFPVNKKALRVR